MGNTTRLLLAGLLAVTLVGSPERAHADAALDRAKALFKRAEGHFGQGKYEQALELYKRAYALKPLPGFLFNLGQCERKLDHCDRAIVHFKEYLRRLPNAHNREIAEDLLRECEATVNRREPPKGDTASPPDPTESSPSPEATTEAATEATPEATPEATTTATPSGEPAERRGLHPAWFWTTASLAAALLVTGTVAGVITLNKRAEFDDTSYKRQVELKDSAQTTGNLSTATFVVGSAAAVAAGVIFFYTGWEAPAAQVSAGPLPGGGAVMLQTSF